MPDAVAATTRLRILVMPGAYPVATQPWISGLAEGLLEAGHRVEVLATPSDAPGSKAGPEARRLLQGLHRVPTRPANMLRRLLASFALLRAAPQGVRPRIVRTLYPWRGGLRGTLLRDIFLAGAAPHDVFYDIIHAHLGVNGVRASVLLDAGLLRGRLVVSFHGSDATRPLTSRRAKRYRRLFACAALVTAPSRFLADRLEELGCPAHKLIVQPSGVDLSRFVFRARREPEDGSVRILSVGRLAEQKGHRIAVEAVAGLRVRRPNVRYDIVGEGSQREPLEALIRERGLEAHVRLLGQRSHADVHARLEGAHVFLQPSVRGRTGSREALGVAVLEAQASGVPVLASDLGGLPEAVTPEALVPAGDVEALRCRLDALIGAPDTWEARGRAGCDLVSKTFDQRALLARWQEHCVRLARGS